MCESIIGACANALALAHTVSNAQTIKTNIYLLLIIINEIKYEPSARTLYGHFVSHFCWFCDVLARAIFFGLVIWRADYVKLSHAFA